MHLLYKVPVWKSHVDLYTWVGGLTGTKFQPLNPQPQGDKHLMFLRPPELSFGSRKLSKVKYLAVAAIVNSQYVLGDRYLFPSNGCGGWVEDLQKELIRLGCYMTRGLQQRVPVWKTRLHS